MYIANDLELSYSNNINKLLRVFLCISCLILSIIGIITEHVVGGVDHPTKSQFEKIILKVSTLLANYL